MKSNDVHYGLLTDGEFWLFVILGDCVADDYQLELNLVDVQGADRYGLPKKKQLRNIKFPPIR